MARRKRKDLNICLVIILINSHKRSLASKQYYIRLASRRVQKTTDLIISQGFNPDCSTNYNNSLIMKQRKKIKYVEKQPPDKTQTSSHNNFQTQPKKQQYRQHNYQSTHTKVEHNPEPAYLIQPKPSNQPYHQKKQQNRTRYVPKDSQDDSPSPNQPYQHRHEDRYRNNRGDKRRNDPQQLPRFLQRQSSNQPELSCIICSQQVRRKDPIWTCACCCISVHLRCIREWIKNVNRALDKQAVHIFSWKCPQCNYEYNEPLPKYYCYCGKHLNPEYDRDLPSHSCGQICDKKRGPYCPHPCTNVCHSGKCKPCEHEGTLIVCQCGKSQRAVKCSEERLAYQCGKKCERILNCHKHKCERNCHTGPCHPCKKKKIAECYCGKGKDVVDCSAPAYSCGEVCAKILNCDHHTCELKCHNGPCNPCNRTPQLQKTCPCGKYQIQMLTGDPEYRKTCADLIPVCGMPCSRKLECGHVCPRSCHQGPCAACRVVVDQGCSCGSQTRKIQCHRKAHNPFKCQLVCKRKRSCGNHLCNTVCCPHRNSPIADNHPCELNCSKMLNCGKHDCGEPCHIGLCKKCPVIYSQAQPCPCGATFLKPPILCGTLPPECENPCNKQLPCGHRCRNVCHYGPCKCYQEVTVGCRCGKEQIRTTCGRQALCLTKCPLLLSCSHRCDLQCHKDSCEQAHKTHPCRKICNKERNDCQHLCPQLCHPGQLCESFPCEAEILVKCECGHRQTMTLCGAHDHHKTKKSIICNKKCENLKRFDIFYKDKQIYYPGGMVQFAFKNYPYLQNLEARLEKFILHSDQNFIQVQYKFPDNHTKLLLTNLFENHYHLNTHFYRHRKYASFSLMQSDHTMLPKPVLSQYVKLISKGTVKQSNLPFEFTISFEMEQREKSEIIMKSIKEFLHKYYSERNGKYTSLHFWSREDGEEALKYLQNQFQTIQFKCSENIVKQEEQVAQEDILQTEDQQPEPAAQATQEIVKESIKDTAEVTQQKPQVQINTETKPPQQKKAIFVSQTAPQKKKIPANQTGSRLIVRRGIPTFKKNQYPDSSQNVQDIYPIDQQQLFNESTNWPQLIFKLTSKNMGPQATEWRIRALLMINSFSPVEETIFHQQFDSLLKMYHKDKEATTRILQIQRIDNKSVKKQMQQNHIYLSDHEPEMLSYLQLYNYFAEDKIPLQYPNIVISTPQMQKTQEILESAENKDYKTFYEHFINSDYVYSCALIPFIHLLREAALEDLIKGARLPTKELHKYLLFPNMEELQTYIQRNGLKIDKRISKSTKEELYFYKEGQLRKDPIRDIEFIRQKVYEKRDKKYFLVQPEELYEDKYMTRSFFAFADFKESVNPSYMNSLVKFLKDRQ